MFTSCVPDVLSCLVPWCLQGSHTIHVQIDSFGVFSPKYHCGVICLIYSAVYNRENIFSPCRVIEGFCQLPYRILSEYSGTWSVNIQVHTKLLTKHDLDKHDKYLFGNITLESWISHGNHSPRTNRGFCVSKRVLLSLKPCKLLGCQHISTRP